MARQKGASCKKKHDIAIIGGGYIGCEFACLFQELGTQVTIIER